MKRSVLVAFAWTLTFCASPSPPTAPIVAAPSSSPLAIREAHAAPSQVDAQLAKERMDAAAAVVGSASSRYGGGTATLDEAAQWNERLFVAQEDVLTGQALVDAARERVSRMKQLEQTAQLRAKSGTAPMTDVSKATYYRASAEIDLARLSR